MSTEQNDRQEPRPAPAEATPPALPYEPPAIAWDELFEVTVAASCLLVAFGDCDLQPTN